MDPTNGQLSGGEYEYDVDLIDAHWNGAACVTHVPETLVISSPGEGCTGTACCSGTAQNICEHSAGEFEDCKCRFSPIIIAMAEGRLELTDAAEGVRFDLRPDGVPEQIAWTRRESQDAFLVLDRDRNGVIDSGKELFGSTTIQPPGPGKNGFKALAVFDTNADGRIDDRDPIYSSLKLWTDKNHNGISEPDELQRVARAGLLSVSLTYKETSRRDRHGNLFKYVSSVTFRIGNRVVTRSAIDVFLNGQ
jgi:hypothetical protein